MIWSDRDLGGRPAHVTQNQGGQMVGSLLLAGDATTTWAQGGAAVVLGLDFWIEAWQALGGQPAGSLGALRLLIQQLEEMRLSPEMGGMMYLQLANTAQPNPIYPARSDARDGWYMIQDFEVDPETVILSSSGNMACQATATLVKIASGSAPVALGWQGAPLNTTYTGGTPPTGEVLGAYPVGSVTPGGSLARTGADGVVPLSGGVPALTPQPLPFVRPPTIAGWFTGGCRVFDTMTAGGNPIPSAGAPTTVVDNTVTTLLAGAYTFGVVYDYGNGFKSAISPASVSVTITATQRILVTANNVPANLAFLDFYVLSGPGGVTTGRFGHAPNPSPGSTTQGYVSPTQGDGSTPPSVSVPYHANWTQVYGRNHTFGGDCILTNGLLLLLYRIGQSGVQVWVWNTKLTVPAWQQAGTVSYLDTNNSPGTLREVGLVRVGWERVRLRTAFSTANSQWGRQDWRLLRGHYDASFDFQPATQPSSSLFAVDLALSNAGKIMYSDAAICDMVNGAISLAPTSQYGFAAVVSQVANSPIVGLLWQNAPATSQPASSSTTEIGAGDTSGPAQFASRTYGVFAAPFTNAPNLQAEAESGSLGTGWTSVANAGASNGNEAQCASGTLSGNANLFGTAWQPQPQVAPQADVWYRMRVSANAGAGSEMTVGLWDVTAGAFVSGASQTLKPNQCQTAYAASPTNWIKINTGGPITIPVGHNVQFRAVTAATLTVNWFVDEAFLALISGAAVGNVGLGDWPADLWEQFNFPVTTGWVPA